MLLLTNRANMPARWKIVTLNDKSLLSLINRSHFCSLGSPVNNQTGVLVFWGSPFVLSGPLASQIGKSYGNITTTTTTTTTTTATTTTTTTTTTTKTTATATNNDINNNTEKKSFYSEKYFLIVIHYLCY